MNMKKKERGLLQQVRWSIAIRMMSLEDVNLVYDCLKESKFMGPWEAEHSFNALWNLFRPIHKRICGKPYTREETEARLKDEGGKHLAEYIAFRKEQVAYLEQLQEAQYEKR